VHRQPQRLEALLRDVMRPEIQTPRSGRATPSSQPLAPRRRRSQRSDGRINAGSAPQAIRLVLRAARAYQTLTPRWFRAHSFSMSPDTIVTRVFDRRSSRRFAALLASLLLARPMPAAATLIVTYVNSASGVVQVARDDVSGLDWLGMVNTYGLSYEQVIGGAGGWIAEGWRYASAGEVCGLVGRYVGIDCPGGASFDSPAPIVPLHYLDAYDFCFRIGIFSTSQCDTIGLFDDGGDSRVGRAEWTSIEPWAWEEFGGGSSTLAIQLDAVGTNEVPMGGIFSAASLLVRPIPEPTTSLLLGIGLLAIGTGRFAH
jgi:hypothetical protein